MEWPKRSTAPQDFSQEKIRVRKPLVSNAGVALQLGVAFFARHVSTYLKHPDGARYRHCPRRDEPLRSGIGSMRGGTNG